MTPEQAAAHVAERGAWTLFALVGARAGSGATTPRRAPSSP